jgi:hypothetical protein
MMMHFYRVLLTLCLLAVSVPAQDPFKVAPKAYKLQFENDWVKVTRVRYEPREKIAAHEHTPLASAYVYLNDGGPVVFNHIDKSYGAVTRAATKAGSFRVYKGIQELHEVENKADVPSEFLRVEFKTDPVDEKTLRGKFFREEYPVGENFQKVQFENEQIRITRLVCAPGKTLDVSTAANQPSILIALSAADVKVSGNKARRVKLGLGESEWVGVNQQTRLENVGAAPVELLRFDFKTRLLTKEEMQKDKKHEHPPKGE